MKIKKLLLFVLIVSPKIYAQTLEKDISSYKAIINNPKTPPAEKEAFRQLLKIKEKQFKKEESLKNRTHKTRKNFKSSKEWYSYFNQEWRGIQSALENRLKDLVENKERNLKVLMKTQKESIRELNKNFTTALENSDLFYFNDIERHRIFPRNDNRKSFYAVLKHILEIHFEARDFDYIRKNPKDDKEKVIVEARLSTFKQNKSLPTVLNNGQLAYLEKEIKRYLEARLGIKKTFVESRKGIYQKLMSIFSEYVQGLPKLSEPPNDSRYYKNYIKKYHKYKIEADGMIFSLGKSIEYNTILHTKLTEQVTINSNIIKRHMLRFISLAKKSLEDKDWLKNRDAYRKLYINSTNNETQIEMQINSELKEKKINRSYLKEVKKSAKYEFKNWVTDYLLRNRLPVDKYLKGGIRRLERWYGPLPNFPNHP